MENQQNTESNKDKKIDVSKSAVILAIAFVVITLGVFTFISYSHRPVTLPLDKDEYPVETTDNYKDCWKTQEEELHKSETGNSEKIEDTENNIDTVTNTEESTCCCGGKSSCSCGENCGK